MLPGFRRRSAARTARVLRYRAAPQVVSARQGDRTILLDARRGRYFGLDETGAEIWRLLGEDAFEGTTLTTLVDRMEESYATSRDLLERDATEFVTRLRRARLVVSA